MQDIYKVEKQVVAGVELPPLLTDATRWKRFTIWAYQRAAITFMDDHQARYEWAVDEKARTIKLTASDLPGGSTPPKGADLLFHYTKLDASHLELAGDVDGKPNVITISVVPRESFLLVNRGFHWHQEYPFNR